MKRFLAADVALRNSPQRVIGEYTKILIIV